MPVSYNMCQLVQPFVAAHVLANDGTQNALPFLCDVRVPSSFWVLPSMKRRLRVRLLACLGSVPPFVFPSFRLGVHASLFLSSRSCTLVMAGAVAMRRAPAWDVLGTPSRAMQ